MVLKDELKKKTVKELRAIVKKYNADVSIRRYSTMKKDDLIEAMLAKEVMSKIKDAPEVKPAPAPTKRPRVEVEIEEDEEPRTTKKGFGIKRMPKQPVAQIAQEPRIGAVVQVDAKGKKTEGKNYVIVGKTKTGWSLREVSKDGKPLFPLILKSNDLKSGESKIVRYLTPEEAKADMSKFIKGFVERDPEPKPPHTLKKGETPYDEIIGPLEQKVKRLVAKSGDREAPGLNEASRKAIKTRKLIALYKKLGPSLTLKQYDLVAEYDGALPRPAIRDVGKKEKTGRVSVTKKLSEEYIKHFEDVMKEGKTFAKKYVKEKKSLLEDVMKSTGVHLKPMQEAVEKLIAFAK